MHPVLFTIGPLQVYAFGCMVALGLAVSLWVMGRRARRDGFPPPDSLLDLVFAAVAAGFLGGRIFYVFQFSDWYFRHPLKIFAVWEGGLIFYGGFLGAMLGLAAVLRAKKIPILAGLDFLSPFVALTHAFGRIGCFLNGCCYGKKCDLPWAVSFPGLPAPVHPTQLYEFFYDVLLFLFLSALVRRGFPGRVFAFYLMGYSAGRFVIETWRANPAFWAGLTLNQGISILLFAAGFFLYRVLKIRGTQGTGSAAGEDR